MDIKQIIGELFSALIASFLICVLIYVPAWTLQQIMAPTGLESSTLNTATTTTTKFIFIKKTTSIRTTTRTTLPPFIFHTTTSTTTTSTTFITADLYKGSVDFKYVKCNPFNEEDVCGVINVSCCPASIRTQVKTQIYPNIPTIKKHYSNGTVYYVSPTGAPAGANTTKIFTYKNITTCMGGKLAAINLRLYSLYYERTLGNCTAIALTSCSNYCTDARNYDAKCINGVCKLIPSGRVLNEVH